MTHIIEKLPANAKVKEWEQLPTGIYQNVGYMAEIAYGEMPTELDGEILQQGEKTDVDRGDVWVLRDTYSAYKFYKIG